MLKQHFKEIKKEKSPALSQSCQARRSPGMAASVYSGYTSGVGAETPVPGAFVGPA